VVALNAHFLTVIKLPNILAGCLSHRLENSLTPKKVLFLALITVACSSAQASNLQLFNVSGTFTQFGAQLSGTLLIDTSTGWVQSADLFYNSQEFKYFSQGSNEPNYPAYYVFSYTTSTAQLPFLVVQLSSPSLVGYTGGYLCSVTQSCPAGNGLTGDYEYGDPNNPSFNLLRDGIASIASPEPGTLVMFGSGVLGLAGFVRRKLNV